jgi:hypothetical protein
MSAYRTKSGSFNKRPYYRDADLENICGDELRKLNLYPQAPSPVRIDRFVEKRFSITPEYADLPEGILGMTKFGETGVQGMTIARSLDEEGTVAAQRRIRTTLAHEAGHGLLHADLFGAATQEGSLFGDFSDPLEPKVLCRDVPSVSGSFRPGYDGRWWEFQANRTIGPLLMPLALVQLALTPLLEAVGSLGGTVLQEARREEAIRMLSQTFDVNPIVAKIRIQELYRVGDEAQLRL